MNGALGSTFVRIYFPSMVNDYAFYFLQSKYQQINTRAKGGGIPHVDPALLWNYDFPIAPLNEQHRIVAKIEELFSELDKGIENLKTARAQLKVYRQALLKHGFEGKLTAQWREVRRAKNTVTPAQAGVHANKKLDSRLRGNDEPLETAAVLLKRIQQERAQRYQQQLADWQANGGSKPKAPKSLPPLTAEELAELPELPEGWGWVRPEEICVQEQYAIGIGSFGSNLKVSDYRESGIPLIFVKNITRSNFTKDLKYIDEAKYKELIPHSVKALDLLITKMGDPPGDCEIYPEGSPNAVLTADCLKFRLWDEFASRKL
ncbi:MAG: restriction endonuclease subunit S [Nitrosomonas sp.]|nr:restriction endonuclease subunit S [Nitrosomonas sp.]MDP1951977.1 restriction endonuclease subunit S [Nitrosomonas sp.]